MNNDTLLIAIAAALVMIFDTLIVYFQFMLVRIDHVARYRQSVLRRIQTRDPRFREFMHAYDQLPSYREMVNQRLKWNWDEHLPPELKVYGNLPENSLDADHTKPDEEEA